MMLENEGLGAQFLNLWDNGTDSLQILSENSSWSWAYKRMWPVKKFKSQYCGNQICMKGVWGDSGHGPPQYFYGAHYPTHQRAVSLKNYTFYSAAVSVVQVLYPQDVHFLNITKNHANDMFSSGTYMYLLEGSNEQPFIWFYGEPESFMYSTTWALSQSGSAMASLSNVAGVLGT